MYNLLHMNTTFYPPRRAGLVFHGLLIVLFFAGSAWSFNQATRTPIGAGLAGYLTGFIGLTLPVPLLAYRMYGLLRSSYTIQAGSVRLVWGLRVEEIPLVDITWVRTQPEIDYRLPFPLVHWPGAVVGVRRLDRNNQVEFMASSRRGLVIIETSRNAYAISPEDPAGFLHAFQRTSEVGTLDAISGQSVRPGALVGSAWDDRPARLLLGAALLLAAGFGAWIFLALDPEAGLRYPLSGTERFVNSTLVFLMPILNSVYFLFDALLGLFFFRRAETRPLAYLLWISSVLASVFFFLAMFLLVP